MYRLHIQWNFALAAWKLRHTRPESFTGTIFRFSNQCLHNYSLIIWKVLEYLTFQPLPGFTHTRTLRWIYMPDDGKILSDGFLPVTTVTNTAPVSANQFPWLLLKQTIVAVLQGPHTVRFHPFGNCSTNTFSVRSRIPLDILAMTSALEAYTALCMIPLTLFLSPSAWRSHC